MLRAVPAAVPRPGRGRARPAVHDPPLRLRVLLPSTGRFLPTAASPSTTPIPGSRRQSNTASRAVSSPLRSRRSTTSSGTTRTGEIKDIDVRLLDLLNTLSRTIATDEPFHVISGYRSPSTNAYPADPRRRGRRRQQPPPSRQGDRHPRPGPHAPRPLSRRPSACTGGGVGIYPASDFVHVDVGRVRTW